MSVGWNQRFAFDRSELSRVHRFLSNNPRLTVSQCKIGLPYGSNKVEGYINYLHMCGVYKKKERALTPLGKVIVRHDPGWHYLGTQFLLQLEIAGQREASVWYHMTNTVWPRFSRFGKSAALAELMRIKEIRSLSTANTGNDLGYYFRSLTCREALGELNLIRQKTKDGLASYKRSLPYNIPPLILAYAVYKQRAEFFPSSKSVAVQRLLEQAGGVGRAFNLYIHPDILSDLIRPLRRRDILNHTRTAELDDIEFLADGVDPIKFVCEYYRSL